MVGRGGGKELTVKDRGAVAGSGAPDSHAGGGRGSLVDGGGALDSRTGDGGDEGCEGCEGELCGNMGC